MTDEIATELEQIEQQPEAQSSSAPSAGAEKRPPEEWAARLGQIIQRDPRLPQSRTRPSWRHAVADKLHGWSQHAYHYQAQPLLITQADYEAALVAGGDYPAKPAHDPALSPIMRKEAV